MIYTIRIRFNLLNKFILNEEDKEIKISIDSAPINEKANKEIIKKVSGHFNTKANNVKIISGLYSKTKLVSISL
jgi:uncharacterized protein (TIGR00251 family)